MTLSISFGLKILNEIGQHVGNSFLCKMRLKMLYFHHDALNYDLCPESGLPSDIDTSGGCVRKNFRDSFREMYIGGALPRVKNFNPRNLLFF